MTTFNRAAFGLFVGALSLASCSKDEETTPALRSQMDYATLTVTTPYTTSFRDASGTSTVDLGAAATRLDMFTELNNYMATVATAVTTPTPAPLDAAKLGNLYRNINNPFTAPALNTSGLHLRERTAVSFEAANKAEAVRTYIDGQLAALATASQSVANTATRGNAGRLGRYLVDARGFEVNQVIQKALIGALVLDQIGNVLLGANSLAADNRQVVTGKPYSEREHNWDLAYAYMTKNPTMTTLAPSTAPPTAPRERFLAGYLNEKNDPASPGVYLAFLKGRAAIVNNDDAMLRTQVDIIRTELEKTIAKSAVSYLASWKSNAAPDVKAHALGEAVGFVYSLQFCTKHGADTAWTNTVLNNLTAAPLGAWDLTNAQADAAIAAINTKFSL